MPKKMKAKTHRRKKASSKAKANKWIKRLSPKAQERIRREGYHLPTRSEIEQTQDLSEDLKEAWNALRTQMLAFGEQEVRTSHRSIMFARKTCYAFIRPKKKFLELNFFLPNALGSELIKKVNSVSKSKWVHMMHVIHSDQVERPLTDWLQEAFEKSR
jgi:hypothetical protein